MRAGPLLRRLSTAVVLPLLTVGLHAPTAPGNTAVPRPMPYGTPVYGVTSDNGYAGTALAASAANLSRIPTTRLVFDEWVPATEYADSVADVRSTGYVMGLLLDSFYMPDYTPAEFQARTTEYLDTLGPHVDIWEIGNEVNGEWLGDTPDTITKISTAFDAAEARGYRTAMTLYYNPECWERPENEMFTWASTNIPDRMRTGLDYVWISYYEEDCENQQFTQAEWTAVFDRLHTLFPDSAIGFGETGLDPANTFATKTDYLRRYYGLRPSTPGYVGGYFWWYYYQDCIPWQSKAMWPVLDEALRGY